MTTYGAALTQLRADAEYVAQWTRDRLDLRAPLGRDLSGMSREHLTETATALERIAGDLHRLAEPDAGLTRYLDRLAKRATAT